MFNLGCKSYCELFLRKLDDLCLLIDGEHIGYHERIAKNIEGMRKKDPPAS